MWSAATRILKRVFDSPGQVDIPSLDVEGTLKEFERRERKLGEGTMQSYKARLRLAVRWYTAYLKDPSTWQSSMASATRTPSSVKTALTHRKRPIATAISSRKAPRRTFLSISLCGDTTTQ